MKNSSLLFGVMSGTSLDGIDVVLVGISDNIINIIDFQHRPYSPEIRSEILNLHSPQHNDLEESIFLSKSHAKITADCINAILKTKTNVLSIGSGIGIVEDLLTNLNSNLKIMSIEPSENASRWVRDNPNICIVDGYFPECIDKGLNFELVYANNIDYVFDDEEYKDFLKSVVDYGVSEFLIITSANYNLKVALKLFIKEILGALGIIEKLADGQFWGYLRSKSEHKKALKHVGFGEIKFSKLGKDTVLIRSKI